MKPDITPKEVMRLVPPKSPISVQELYHKAKIRKFEIKLKDWEAAALKAGWEPPEDHELELINIPGLNSIINDLISNGSLILDTNHILRRPPKNKT